MVKNPPSNAEDAGSITGQGTKIPHAAGKLSLRTATRETTTKTQPKKKKLCLHNLDSASSRGTKREPKGEASDSSALCAHAKSLSCDRLFVTPWTVAHQAPLGILPHT